MAYVPIIVPINSGGCHRDCGQLDHKTTLGLIILLTFIWVIVTTHIIAKWVKYIKSKKEYYDDIMDFFVCEINPLPFFFWAVMAMVYCVLLLIYIGSLIGKLL